ncbi:hypothetical protein HDU87_007685 [Geranomyces variabilis]|uniref:Uncharacterized protein n=1 Tax=Geranomyces variabilis TaxID=109894 RepID=A0AAD5XN56_9FUNG|nr:hypothetical protein HDU87_007685 [Geranomyces variabilis]
MTRRHPQPLLTTAAAAAAAVALGCLLSAALPAVDAFDPTPAPTPLVANATLVLPALACQVLTYTLPANHSLSLSLTVSPPLLALGFTTDPAQPCAAPYSATGVGTDYVQILDTIEGPGAASGVYPLNNITAARCWTAPVTLRFFAATAFPAANGKQGAADAKSVAVGNIVALPTGNRTCVSPPAPAAAASSPAAPAAVGGATQGSTTAAPGAKQSWSLAPPPPGTNYVQSAGAATDLAGGLASVLAVFALAFV